MWMLWLILCGLFLIIEIFTDSFLFLWPGIGAFISFIVSFFTDNFAIQVGCFAIVTTLLIIFTKPLVKKLMKNNDHTKMNKDGIIGKTGIVIKDIDNLNSTGQVKVNGELWSAFSEISKDVIPKDSIVMIKGIDGVKLRVIKIK